MATQVFGFPEAIDLEKIEQITLPQLEMARDNPFLENFPDESRRDTIVKWFQKDNYTGLQQWRGYGGQPMPVDRVGETAFIATPGVYGEKIELDEEECTRRRMMGTFGALINVSDLVAEAQEQLLIRRLQLKTYILAQWALNGTYLVRNKAGQIMKQDSYTPQTFTPAVPWSTVATATPIADIRAMQLIPFGQSVLMDANAELVINRNTFNNLIQNRNANDLGGQRLNGLAPIQTMTDLNNYLAGQNLPKIRVFDGFWLATDGTKKGNPTRLVPNTQGVLFGRRTSGAKPGTYQYTANMANADAAPKPYTRVHDTWTWQVPGVIEVHDGHNGGPTIKYPGTIVSITGL